MPREIRVIVPIANSFWNKEIEEFCNQIKEPDTGISIVNLEKGPESIESYFDEALAEPYVALEALKAEKEGYDAVAVYCFGNPGVNAARAVVNIPVIGAGEAAVMMAALISNKFSIISTVESAVPRCYRTVKLLGVEGKLVSVETVNMPVLRLSEDKARLEALIVNMGRKAVAKGADVIVLGCTGMAGMRKLTEEKLGVPVVDPAETVLKMAEAMAALNLKHSKRYFRHDSEKRVIF